jgi:hypothetical protein
LTFQSPEKVSFYKVAKFFDFYFVQKSLAPSGIRTRDLCGHEATALPLHHRGLKMRIVFSTQVVVLFLLNNFK